MTVILTTIAQMNEEENEMYRMHYLTSAESGKILINGGNEVIDQLNDDATENDTFKKPWGKLNKQNKLNRIMKFIKEIHEKNNIDEVQTRKLRILLINAINNRLITRKSDVEYCEKKGEILRIEKLKKNHKTGEFQIGDTPRLSKVTNVAFKLPTNFNFAGSFNTKLKPVSPTKKPIESTINKQSSTIIKKKPVASAKKTIESTIIEKKPSFTIIKKPVGSAKKLVESTINKPPSTIIKKKIEAIRKNQ